MSHGYSIIGKAGKATSFIPSLIGVLRHQEDPSVEDMYFVRYDIEDYAAGSVTSLAVTQWDCYDSLPLDRDPIIAVKGRHGNYYIPLSELEEVAAETGDQALAAMIIRLVTNKDG